MNQYLFYFFVIFLIANGQAFAADKLIFSVDLIRHGDRNPVIYLPKSPYQWEGEPGELTKIGINQERDLGARVRSECVEQFQLLPQTYEEGTVYVRSTYSGRAIESAKAFLTGLYPSEFRKIRSAIPIEIVDQNKDDLLLVKPAQDSKSHEKLVSLEKNFLKAMMAKYGTKTKIWQNETGVPIENCDQAIGLSDHLRIRQLKGVPSPGRLSQSDIKEILEFGDSCMRAMFHQKEMTEPTGLKFLSALKAYFDETNNDSSKLKYVLFSAHDSTIMAVLNTLGATFDSGVDYASRLNFALFEISGKPQIRVSLNGKAVDSSLCPKGVCSPLELFQVLEKQK